VVLAEWFLFDFVSGKKEIQLNFLEEVKVFFGRIVGGVDL
jgi:hypothetical protein